MRFKWLFAAAALAGMAASATPARATVLLPGTTVVTTNASPASFGAVIASSTQNFTGLDAFNAVKFTGAITTEVRKDGLGHLTVDYVVSNSSTSADAIGRVSNSSFAGLTTNVFLDSGFAVANRSSGAGSGVRFSDFNGLGGGINPGMTVTLIIQTNGFVVTPGSTALQNDGNATVVTFATAVPEPGTMVATALSIGCVGALGVYRRRKLSV